MSINIAHNISKCSIEINVINTKNPLIKSIFIRGLYSISWYKIGSPKGTRTPVSAVRGRRPGPLDDRAINDLAAGLGFEPRQHDPES